MNQQDEKPYCLMPWIHLHSGVKGKVQACCVANISLGDINEQSKNEIWNGSAIKKLRNQFENQIPDKRCSVCVNVEKAGGKSIRMETHEKFSGINYKELEGPIYFDIRFSNVCNYKCRTCWHGASSSWFENAKQLKSNLGDKAIIHNVQDLDYFIEEWGDDVLKAQEIYFAGGEPLMMEEHYLLLDFLIKNEALNIHLRYNTNLSNLHFKKENIIEKWKRFKKVTILASIDDIEENGEYIRQNFKWNVVNNNRNLLKQLPNVDFKIAPTISTLNVSRLNEFIPQLIKEEFIDVNGLYINILDRPLFYNIQALFKEEKVIVTDKLKNLIVFLSNNQTSEETIKSIEDIINFMNDKDLSKHRQKGQEYNTKLDQLFNRK